VVTSLAIAIDIVVVAASSIAATVARCVDVAATSCSVAATVARYVDVAATARSVAVAVAMHVDVATAVAFAWVSTALLFAASRRTTIVVAIALFL